MKKKLVKEQSEDEIEAIVDVSIMNNTKFYRAKWKNMTDNDSTWETALKICHRCELYVEYKKNVEQYGPQFYVDPKDPAPQLKAFLGEPKKRGKKVSKQQIKIAQISAPEPVQSVVSAAPQFLNDLLEIQSDTLSLIDQQKYANHDLKLIALKYFQQQSSHSSVNGSQILESDIEGDFSKGDQVERILQSKFLKNGDYSYYCMWKKRLSQRRPRNSWLSMGSLKDNCKDLISDHLKNKAQS